MKVQLDRKFPIPASSESAWQLLRDLNAVATCMPGAEITEQVDEHRYKGKVKLKVGPATMSFRGTVEAQDIDPERRSLRLVGKGTDTTGGSAASMNLLAHIDDTGDGECELVGSSEVTMSGKAAAFGGRMMDSVADKILQQFADNFAARIAAPAAGAANADKPESPAGQTSRSSELNAIALAWSVIKDWLRALFGKNKA